MARQVNRFVQIVVAGFRIGIRPKQFDQLFTVKLMMRLQGQQLNQQSRFAARPLALGDHATIH